MFLFYYDFTLLERATFQFLNAVGNTPWMGDQPVARPLSTHRTTQTQYTHTDTDIYASSVFRSH
jgi:hypothetical protein